VEPIDRLGVFGPLGSEESGILGSPGEGEQGTIVDRDANKKGRRRKMSGADKKMDQAESGGVGALGEASPGAELDNGLSPNLQAHIGRHVRAVFDEVAREPIPEHLLRLLKDLERSGDK
jgi:Anti-sigma factor NepR